MEADSARDETAVPWFRSPSDQQMRHLPLPDQMKAEAASRLPGSGVNPLSSVKSFNRSPSLQERLQQALARKTGQVSPFVEAETPPPNLSKRLEAALSSKQLGGSNGFRRGASLSREHGKEAVTFLDQSEGLTRSQLLSSERAGSGAMQEASQEARSTPNVVGNHSLSRKQLGMADNEPGDQPQKSNGLAGVELQSGSGSEAPSQVNNYEQLSRKLMAQLEREHQLIERSFNPGPSSDLGETNPRPSNEQLSQTAEVDFLGGSAGVPGEMAYAGGKERQSLPLDLNLSVEQSAEDDQTRDFWGTAANMENGFSQESEGTAGDKAALGWIGRGHNGAHSAEAQTLKPERQTLKLDAINQVVDLSSDSEEEDEPLLSNKGGFHWGGKKRELPDWAATSKGPSKRRPFHPPGKQSQGGGHYNGGFLDPRASLPESGLDKGMFFASSGGFQSRGRQLPDWDSKEGSSVNGPSGVTAPSGVNAPSSQPLRSEWPVPKPGSLEALRGPQQWGTSGGFPRSQSELDREAAKALAGPLREAAMAHMGHQGSLQTHYQQQAVEHQRQQQAHFQRRILPATMHTHTLSAGPSVPRDNDVALRGVLEGMAVDGPTEESTPPEGSMTVPLLKHQRLALSWMKKRESGTITNQPVGGVLADDQGLGKTITTIALIMSNKAPPRAGPKEAPPPGRDSPAPTVNLDDYKEVFVTSANEAVSSRGGVEEDEDELMEIPPEKVQLRLEYRPGGSREGSQQRGSDVARDVSEERGEELDFGSKGFLYSDGDGGNGGAEEQPDGFRETGGAEAPAGGFLQDIAWGGESATNSQENGGGLVELGGLRLENGVLLAGGSQPHQNESETTPLAGLKRKRGATKKDKGAKLEVQENSSGGVPRDPLSRRGRPPAGTLIVCPTSVLRQWASEVRDKVAREENIRLLIYHGVGRTRDPHELAQYDIVLTTYAIVSMEVPKQPLPESEGGGSNGSEKPKDKPPQSKAKKKSKALGEDEGLLPPGSGPLARVAWFRVVLDEAQSIKNARTQAARAAWSLRAKRRWCLSGTPIQNSVDDLYSYFRFLRFAPYDVFKSFRSLIREPIARNPAVGYRRLQVILSMVMMRRTKQTVIEGRPIIDLPPRIVELSQADFSPEERGFYDTLERESRQKFNAFWSAGTLNKNYVNILWMLLRLRQACNHWSLVKGLEGGDHHASKEAEAVARKLRPELRATMMAEVEGLQSPCPLCHDAPEEAVVSKCCHVFCRQCIAEQVNNTDNLEAYACPLCKSPITAKDVFSPATLRKVETGQLDPLDAATSSSDGSGRAPAVRSSSKINNMVRILSELPRRVVSVSTETGHIVGDHKQEDSAAGSPEEAKGGVYVRETTEKAIIFSQWTSMLDLLEGPLQHAGFQYRRLDGTMTVHARDRAISDFTKRPEVTVMIMSLKAASLGLNLVAASHVLLLDVWWNPTTEDQAIDRAHRIGQTRTVHVSRLAVRGTVEDRILALQDKKRQIVASAFGEQEGGGTARLSAEDLAFLFRSP